MIHSLLFYFQGKIGLLKKFIPDRFIMYKIKHLFLNLSFFHSTVEFGHLFLSTNMLSEHHFNCCLVVYVCIYYNFLS